MTVRSAIGVGVGLLALSIAAGSASGESVVSDGILLSFDCSGESAVLTNVSGTAITGYVEIPERVCGKNVVSIDYMVRGESQGIAELTLPRTLTNFEPLAFCWLKQLERFKVADGSLSFCTRDGLLYDLEGKVLLCCPSARQKVEVPEGTIEIAHYGFSRTLIEEVSLPDSLLVIGDCGFSSCYHLGKVSLPPNLRKIGDGAFKNWQWSGGVDLPKDLEYFGREVFSHSKLKFLHVDEGNKNFKSEDSVLYDFTRTKLIYCPPCGYLDDIPEGVVSIEPYAIAWFEPNYLGIVGLPESLRKIGNHAFFNAHFLSLEIPAGVTNIEAWAFSGCQADVAVSAQNEKYFMSNGGLIYERKSQWNPVRGREEECFIAHSSPRGLGGISWGCTLDPRTTEIEEGAFAYSGLAGISIPCSVRKIGPSAFYSCLNLIEITFPGTVTNIGRSTFTYSRNLKVVSFEGEKPDVGGTDLYDGTHKDLMTYVSDDAHSWDQDVLNGTWMSRRIGWRSSSTPEEPESAGGSYVCDGVVLNCECSGAGAVLTNMTGTALTGYIVLPETVGNKPLVEVGKMTWTCSGVLQVGIPKTITNIATLAFNDCRSLASIIVAANNSRYTAIQGVLYDKSEKTLLSCPHVMKELSVPNGVERIADFAFFNCSIESVQMPEGVRSIGESAFYNCYSMRECRLPSTVQEIGVMAFGQCYELRGEYTLPSALKSLGKGAFFRTSIRDFVIDDTNESFRTVDGILFDKQGTTLVLCPPQKQLQSYPEGIIRIGESAFISVKSVPRYIPDSVLEIGRGAFNDVWSPDCITVGANVTNIGTYAFESTHIKYIDVSSKNQTFFVRNRILYDRRIPWPWSVASVGPIHLVAHSAPYGIEKADLIDGTEEIAEGVFASAQISEIIIPESVKRIGESAFAGCRNLKRVLFRGEKPDVVGADLYLGSSRELTTFVGDCAHSWDGDVRSGLWMDRRIENCASVLPLGGGGATVESVPLESVEGWLLPFGENAVRDFADRYGEDMSMAMRLPSGKTDSAGRPMYVWEDFIAGTNPIDSDSKFEVSITLVDGLPVITWTPELSSEQAALRNYTVYGKSNLNDAEWSVVDGDEGRYSFFKVGVEMK